MLCYDKTNQNEETFCGRSLAIVEADKQGAQADKQRDREADTCTEQSTLIRVAIINGDT